MQSTQFQQIERVIVHSLVEEHHRLPNNPTVQNSISVPMFSMYQIVYKIMPFITTLDFNNVVQNMKKVGLIGTAKGGDLIYLKPEARALHVKFPAALDIEAIGGAS
jgi:hypothetical protein